MYQNFKQWFLEIMFPKTYGGIYIPFSEEMQKWDRVNVEIIYWLIRNAGNPGSDFILYLPSFAGWPSGVRIFDKQIATMFKLRFKIE